MCFNKNERTITSRYYMYWSGSRTILFHASKKDEEILRIDVKNDKGEIQVILKNRSTEEKQILDNPKTDIYDLPLVKGNYYTISMISHGSCGHIIIKKIKKLDD